MSETAAAVGGDDLARLLASRAIGFARRPSFTAIINPHFLAAERLAVAHLPALADAPGATGTSDVPKMRAGGPVGALHRELAAAFVDDDGGRDVEPPASLQASEPDMGAVERARADAFAAGLEEGRRRAEAASGAAIADIARLARALAAAREVDTQVLAGPLAAATLALVYSVLDAEPELASATLAPRVQAALARLKAGIEPVALTLHPDDVAALRPALEPALAGTLTIVADPTLSRGDFALATAHARLDDRVADRLEQLATALK